MAASNGVREISPMASPWRRRTICTLVADGPAAATLREISAAGAVLQTTVRPALGDTVELRHPDAGSISGQVRAIREDGIALSFPCSERSVAFALAAIAADMSRPVS